MQSPAVQQTLRRLYAEKQRQDNDFFLQACATIDLLRAKLSSVSQTEDQKTLKEMIDLTAKIVNASGQSERNQAEINQLCNQLQRHALQLPNAMSEKNNLGATGHKIAMACLFVFVLSVSVALGIYFSAWYASSLTLKLCQDILVYTTASIGIPAGGLGLFGYALHRSNERKNVSEEQIVDNINALCLTC